MRQIDLVVRLGRLLAAVGIDLLRFVASSIRSRTALVAENLFLWKQVALYRERRVKPRRASDPLRLTLVLLARWFAWREALTIVQLATLLRSHRDAFRLFPRRYGRSGGSERSSRNRTATGSFSTIGTASIRRGSMRP